LLARAELSKSAAYPPTSANPQAEVHMIQSRELSECGGQDEPSHKGLVPHKMWVKNEIIES
jgi:hypothetical protein